MEGGGHDGGGEVPHVLENVRVDAMKETVDSDETNSMKANFMKEDINKYAELTEVYKFT